MSDNVYWRELQDRSIIDLGGSFVTDLGDLIYWHGNESYEAQSHLQTRSIKKEPETKKEKPMAKKLSPEAQGVIRASKIEGNLLTLPGLQLHRELYVEVKNALEGITGKWNKKAQGFIFDRDPNDYIEKIMDGERINVKKDLQYFATPDSLALRLVEMADLQDDDAVLEPSAGTGAILNMIHEVQAQKEILLEIDAIEIDAHFAKGLKQEYKTLFSRVEQADFLQVSRPGKYDKIIANPPFSGGQDMQHVLKMWECLSEGGKLVSIMSTSVLFNSTKQYSQFRNFFQFQKDLSKMEVGTNERWQLLQHDGTAVGEVYIERLDTGAFKDSGTMVNTLIIQIEKYEQN